MPRVIENHEQIIKAFESVEMVSELVERLPSGEFRNELNMDIILFGRSYRGKQVGPYARLLEYAPGEIIVEANTWESSIFYVLVEGVLEASVTNLMVNFEKLGEIHPRILSVRWPFYPVRKERRRSRAVHGKPGALCW